MVTMNSSEKAAQKACQQGPSRENSRCENKEKEKDKDRDKKDVVINNMPANIQALMSAIPSPEESPNFLVYKKVLVTLAFYASGSYQNAVANSIYSAISQPTASRAIRQVTKAMNSADILSKYLIFPTNRDAREKIKRGFYDKYKMPGIIGCIDGTHVAIVKPAQYEDRYINRKGYHSLNVMIMEAIIERMQDENTGVPVKTVKSFMSKIPSVFTGTDLVAWIMKNLDIEESWEALHLAHLLASHGYLFPIDDHCLTVKNDNTYYRFQTPYFWPSNQWEPENTDYAVYLCKRTMQNKARLELADYEAESLARLQKMFTRKWEFIFMQAEAQSKVDKKRDKLERKVLDSQERAFWDVHRPMPGCINTMEVDPRKQSRINALKAKRMKQCQDLMLQHNLKSNPIVTITNPQESEEDIKKVTEGTGKENGESSTADILDSPSNSSEMERKIAEATQQLSILRARARRRDIPPNKVADMLISYSEQYAEYDPFLTPPEYPNPWINDTTELWDQEKLCKEPLPLRRVRRWAFGLRELLQDSAGRDHFARFLSKEFSGENLKFWLAVQDFKCLPMSRVASGAKDIWKEFLGSDAPSPVNIDAATREATRLKVESGVADRYCFDQAQAHVYHLMKSDSYSRYLRSEMYKDYLNGAKKKTSVKGIRSIVSFTARKETSTN